jgi:PAS domain-containing protein
MLAEDIDFYQVFKIHPTSMLLLTADLEIVDANETFLEESGRELDDLIGHHLFEEFPKMPTAPSGDDAWSAAEAAMTSGKREHNLLFREDIEDHEHPGVFVEHYWSSVAQPVRGRDGEVEFIEFSLRDVTPIIDEYRVLQSEERQLGRAVLGRSDCGLLASIG